MIGKGYGIVIVPRTPDVAAVSLLQSAGDIDVIRLLLVRLLITLMPASKLVLPAIAECRELLFHKD